MKKVLLLTFIIFSFISCQETEIINLELPYVDVTVIYGEIPLESAFKGIWITRTLPLNSSYKIEEGEITNAVAYLKMNNLEIIPLSYEADGCYLPFNTIYPASGQYYELFIDIEGKKFYGKSVIPFQPMARKVALNDKIINVEIIGKPDESYGALWAYINSDDRIILQADDFHSIVDSKGDNQIVDIRTQTIPDSVFENTQQNHLKVIVYAFGKNFGDYYNSRAKNSSIENSLTQGGSPIYTNISGDKVIGAFTGSAKSVLNITVNN